MVKRINTPTIKKIKREFDEAVEKMSDIVREVGDLLRSPDDETSHTELIINFKQRSPGTPK